MRKLKMYYFHCLCSYTQFFNIQAKLDEIEVHLQKNTMDTTTTIIINKKKQQHVSPFFFKLNVIVLHSLCPHPHSAQQLF